MKENKTRKTIRLQEYDYSQNGFYFITICTQCYKCLFGKVDDEMVLNQAGKMVEKIWNDIPKFYPNTSIDAFQIMPNHIHGIIIIDNPTISPFVGAAPCGCPNNTKQLETGQPQGAAPTKQITVPNLVQYFKTITTTKYIEGVKKQGWYKFNKRLWQRNYYEHIIRNEQDLNRLQNYIINNPIAWQKDEYYK